MPRPSDVVEGQRCRQRNWEQAADGLPVVAEDDMSIEAPKAPQPSPGALKHWCIASKQKKRPQMAKPMN